MGTSKGFSTPKGGAWKPLKNDVTDYLGGTDKVTPEQVVGGTVKAAGGLLGAIRPNTSGLSTKGTGGSGGGGSATGGRRSVGRALSGLSGFGAAVQRGGLREGLQALGLEELQGRPAAEIIAAIAEHLSNEVDGLAGEVLSDALRNTVLEAAALAGDPTYENLDVALQGFLTSEGVAGLVELFLGNVAFDQVWSLIENHAGLKSDTASQTETLAEAVRHCCRSEAHAVVERAKGEQDFSAMDWFGADGARLADQIASRLELRLTDLAE